ncbi:hypothetical protein Tco_0721027 [Tanacetum coccineum]
MSLSTSDRRLIELENQVQRLMEAHLALTKHTQVNKITTSCEICSGPSTHSVSWKDPEQALFEYHPRVTDERELSMFEADFKRQQGEMTNKIDIVLKAIADQIASTLPSDTIKNLKLGTHPVSFARSYPTVDPQCSTQIHSSINTITIYPKQQSDSHDSTEENEGEERGSPENHPDSPTPPDPLIEFITKKVLKFNSVFESLGLVPPSPNAELVCTKEEDSDKYHNMTHDPPEGVVRFINGTDEVAYNMPHNIEQYDSLSNVEKEHTKSVYLRNKEDKKRGVEYVMSKILGFYKECLDLGPEYLRGMDDEGEVT